MAIDLGELRELRAGGIRSRRRRGSLPAATQVEAPGHQAPARPLTVFVNSPGRPATNRSVGLVRRDDGGTEVAVDLRPRSGNLVLLPARPVPLRPPAAEAAAPARPTVTPEPDSWVRTALSTLLRSMVVVAVWGLAITVAARVHPTRTVHSAALFGHLIGLTCGFGAVIVLDVYGAACLTRRRSPVDVARLSVSLDSLIWGGFFLLVLTGSLLGPHLAHPLTQIKVAAVLVAGLNGVNAHGMRERVKKLHPATTLRELPSRLLWRLFITATVSQLAWWTCVFIGFKNTPH